MVLGSAVEGIGEDNLEARTGKRDVDDTLIGNQSVYWGLLQYEYPGRGLFHESSLVGAVDLFVGFYSAFGR